MNKAAEINIVSLELISAMVLQIQFSSDWSMEDCETLSEKLLMLTSAKVIERVQGADLYSVRVQFQHSELLLNFEEYSHSCWLECATEHDAVGLLAIKEILVQSTV